MGTNHKTFKPFDKVLVRNHYDRRWKCDVYSHKTGETGVQTIHDIYSIENVLPYEGNEELVGATDEPDEEVRLEKGEWLMVSDVINIQPELFKLRRYDRVDWKLKAFNNATASLAGWNFAIRFSDFNPNDMEETKKHILCVKNGKVVKYKPEMKLL